MNALATALHAGPSGPTGPTGPTVHTGPAGPMHASDASSPLGSALDLPVPSPLAEPEGEALVPAWAPPTLAWLFARTPHTTIQHCLLLALLLHVWLVLMLGSAPGGTALPGEGVAGTLNISLRGPATAAKSDPAATAEPVPVLATGPTGTATLSRWGGAVRDTAPPELSEPGTARLGQWAATAALPVPQPPTPSVAPLGRVAPLGPLAPLGAVTPPGPASLNPVLQPMPTLPAVANPGGALPASPTVKAPLPLPSAPAPAGLTAPLPTAAATAGRPTSLGPVPVPAALPEPAATALAPAVPPPAPESLRSLSSGLISTLPGGPEAPLTASGRSASTALPGVAVALPLPPAAVVPLQAAVPSTAPAVPIVNQVPPPLPSSTLAVPAPTAAITPNLAAPTASAAPTAPTAAAAAPSASTAPAPSAATVPRPAPPPAVGLTGAPDAGTRLGADQATPPSANASAPPRLNLQLNRPRSGELSRLPSAGVLQLMPRPPELPDKLATDIKKAAKPDCKDAYAGAGLLAVVPLAADALRKDGGCKW